jgi:4-amino-4-deoxy-L-arabinose transferase-like glycosyltransferase
MISFFKNLSNLEKSIIICVLIIYIHNLFIDIMNIDAAQYACISFEMASTNSYLEVKEFGYDYLDKPPLLFWLSSLSIKLFGTTNFAYKLPSFLFLLASLYAVYKFTLLYYSEKIAKNAVLILATTQAYFLITNDVRTDSLLTSCTIISIWLFSEYFKNRKLTNFIWGSVFVGLGMLAKGPIAAIAVLLPIGINLMYQQKWRDVFNFRWFLALLIICLVLFPMSYGLYTQFDAQPEKGKSGLYFYYWLQSFGRITGENVWNNGLPWHFFLGSSIWDFFPWIVPLYVALFFKISTVLKIKIKVPEITTLVGLISIFLMLSLSKYKLPHYIFVTFPFAAIIVAHYLSNLEMKTWKRWKIIYYFFGLLIIAIFILYQLFFFTEFNIWVVVSILLQLLILFYFRKIRTQNVPELLILAVTLNLFLSFVFYPKLLTYQADSRAAKWATTNIKNDEVFLFDKASHAYNFYSKNSFTKVIHKTQITNLKKPFWLYIRQEDFNQLNDLKIKIIEKKTFANYPITRLKLNFLLENERANVIQNRYLIKIEN